MASGIESYSQGKEQSAGVMPPRHSLLEELAEGLAAMHGKRKVELRARDKKASRTFEGDLLCPGNAMTEL